MTKDFVTPEFKAIFTQLLFDKYTVNCHSIEKIKIERIERCEHIRYSFDGYLNEKPFQGSINFILNEHGHGNFTVSGWFKDLPRFDFVESIVKNNNAYLQSIKDVGGWLTFNFGNPIDIQTGYSWIGRGSFNYQKGLISNIVINMTPSSRGKIALISMPKYRRFELLTYSLFEKDNTLTFNYKAATDECSCSPVDVVDNYADLDKFKTRFVREYMLMYSKLTGTPNLLSLYDFNTLSYDHIIGYLTVQQMEAI
jgi:hypothetical protein